MEEEMGKVKASSLSLLVNTHNIDKMKSPSDPQTALKLLTTNDQNESKKRVDGGKPESKPHSPINFTAPNTPSTRDSPNSKSEEMIIGNGFEMDLKKFAGQIVPEH